MIRPKITREEEEGPLRRDLKLISQELGHEYGGPIFAAGRDLANGGLDLAIDLEQKHGLGDTDRSIPPTTHSIAEQRRRRTFQSAKETKYMPAHQARL